MKLTAMWLASLAGCAAAAGDDATINELDQEVATTNGLPAINGLSTQNGLNTQNGLHVQNGLNTQNGLADAVGLMSTDAGRTTLSYLVKCALPAGHSITKKDQTGKSYTFQGALGVGKGWETGACDQYCQQWISACMVAHINTAGVHIPLWVVADNYLQPQIGWGLSASYPNQEGTFFGNIFASPPQMYYCNGRNYNTNVVPGRIGSNQTNAPYTDPFGANGYCDTYCTKSDYPNATSGYKACMGFNNTFTVWRQ